MRDHSFSSLPNTLAFSYEAPKGICLLDVGFIYPRKLNSINFLHE